MKVLHFGTLDMNAGGPANSAYLTLLGLRDIGVDAQLAMYSLNKQGVLRGDKIPVHFMGKPINGRFAFSPLLKRKLLSLGEYDIFHAQGIWQYPTYALIDIAKKAGKPYVVTPRGMLYPQDIFKSNSFLKKVSLQMRLLKDLNNAACVHVTCNEERDHCRRLGVTSPIAVIPNPVEYVDFPVMSNRKHFILGYLGRLSKRKRIEFLIYAFADLAFPDAELVIVGGGDVDYERFLKAEVNRLKLHNVSFLGFLSGEAKEKVLANMSVLALPSEFENFGNVIVEALAHGIPCIATHGAPWKDLEDYHCGWWVPNNRDAIKDAIANAWSLHLSVLEEMGNRGKQLVLKKYSMNAVAQSMKSVYNWILHDGECPEFLYK